MVRPPKVIPDGWEAHHKPVMDATRTATAHIWSGSDQQWTTDPETGDEIPNRGQRLTTEPVTVRVQQLNREDATQAAGTQKATTRRYLIALDRDLLVEVTEMSQIEIITSTDTWLTGRFLHVEDIQLGSLRFERHLICLDHLTP